MEQYPIGCLLKMITDKIKIQADANLAQHDLTLTQSRVLGYLARSGGTATQKEIEGFLQVSHPTVAASSGAWSRRASCPAGPTRRISAASSSARQLVPPRSHIKCRRHCGRRAADAPLAEPEADRGAGRRPAHDLC